MKNGQDCRLFRGVRYLIITLVFCGVRHSGQSRHRRFALTLLQHALLQLATPIQLAHKAARIAPSRLCFYVQFQKDFGSQHALDLDPCRGPDFLEHAPALAHQDSFLSIAFAIDCRSDAREPLPFLEVFDHHGGGIGNFFTGIKQDLFPNSFGRHESRRLIGNLVFRKISRPRGKDREDAVEQNIESLALECRDRKDLSEVIKLAVFLDDGQQLRFFADKIHFVEDQKSLALAASDQVERKAVPRIELMLHVHDYQHEIAAFQSLADFNHHLAAERTVGLVHTRRIDEHDLAAIATLAFRNMDYTLNAVARGLWLRRDDGELFAHQRIEQRRLARVGPTENTNETGAKWHRGL